ncbi:MAG: hypothetical protein WCS42_20345 [Verrucomicrobiota bacterium]
MLKEFCEIFNYAEGISRFLNTMSRSSKRNDQEYFKQWERFVNTLQQALFFASFLIFGKPALGQQVPAFAAGVTLGTISIPELGEASGLVASRNNADVLWIHNDSGNPAHLFAIDTNGRWLGTYTPSGEKNVDWEDIGIGPGPITNVLYLYIGDIGDNREHRSHIKVFQIPEPAVYVRQHTNPVTVNFKGVRAITLTYPDGAHNAESLFMDPLTGDMFIITKERKTSRVYTAPKAALDTSLNIKLSFVRNIAFDQPSGADISPAGTEIIIRYEDYAMLWTRNPSQTVGDALGGTSVRVPVIGRPIEPNGEAVAFTKTGNGYYTVSEGVSPKLYYFERTNGTDPPKFQALIPAGAAWNYLGKGTDQGTEWRNLNFNDSCWSNGITQFGNGNDCEYTRITHRENPTNETITIYFRKTFTASKASSLTRLTLKLVMADGAAVYLNGVNVLNYQLPIHHNYGTPASATQAPNLEDTWFSFPISPELLANGTNILAVEVHKATPKGSDLIPILTNNR